jgi:hypothetical protein
MRRLTGAAVLGAGAATILFLLLAQVIRGGSPA